MHYITSARLPSTCFPDGHAFHHPHGNGCSVLAHHARCDYRASASPPQATYGTQTCGSLFWLIPPGTAVLTVSPARPGRRAPYAVEKVVTDQTPISLFQAREGCRTVVGRFVRLIASGWPPGRPWLLTYPPGVGKTQALVEELNQRLPTTPGAQVLVVAPTHELLSEIESKLEVPAVHVFGRPEDMCEFPEVAKAMNEKRFDMGKHVCERVCPFRDDCGYYEQFKRPAQVWLVTPQMARSKRFQHWRIGKKPANWLLIAYDDVNPLAAFVDEMVVTHGDLLRAAGALSDRSHKMWLYAIAEVATNGRDSPGGLDLWTKLKVSSGGMESLSELVGTLRSNGIPQNISPTFSRKTMTTVEEVEMQIPAFVEPLFEALLTEGAKYVSDEAFNAQLSAESNSVTLRWREYPNYLNSTSVLVLDATPDLEAWNQVFGRGSTVYGSEPVSLPPHVDATQFADYFNGKAALQNPDRRARLISQLDDLVPRLPKPTVIISFQSWNIPSR